MIGLIGPSGAGKSTLIRCTNRLVGPTAGRILLNDREITGLGRGDLRKIRRSMGMIFQEFALVERLTVMENALSGRLGYVPFWRSYLRRFPPSDVRNAFPLSSSEHQYLAKTHLSHRIRAMRGSLAKTLRTKSNRQLRDLASPAHAAGAEMDAPGLPRRFLLH